MADERFLGRRSVRLKAFDYAGNAAYFLTLCAHQRQHRFGNIENGFMGLNEVGGMVEREWIRSASIRSELELHSFVVMPNHLHALVIFTPPERIDPAVGAHGMRPFTDRVDSIIGGGSRLADEKGACHAPLRRAPRSLGSFVSGFKSATTREFRMMTGDPDGALWQRGYYEHVVRDERDFARIGDYIAHNAMNWQFDQENMDRES